MTAGPVRTLVLTDDTAWPTDTGYRQRLSHVLTGLCEAGHVTWVVMAADSKSVHPVPVALQDDPRLDVVLITAPWRPVASGLLRYLAGWAPWWVARRDWDAALAGLPAVQPDLVWCSHLETWGGLRRVLPDARLVIDLDNVMDVVVTRRARRAGRLRGVVLRLDAHRWRLLRHRARSAGATLVVCSQDDAEVVGTGAVVVPNAYESPEAVVRRPAQPPTLLLVGSFDYPPNDEAAQWCARQVLPLVRALRPDVRLRLVGRPGAGTPALAAVPGVDVVGRVDDLGAELSAAAVCVVPLLVGGGTRVKLLEAFAAKVPVVSTSVGAEGTAARDGTHLLLADDAAGFAAACLLLIDQPEVATRLAEAGEQLWAQRYRGSQVRAAVTELARRRSTSA